MSKIVWGLKVNGLENIPTDRPLIFAANHTSVLDPLWLISSLPWEIRRKTFSIGKIELLKISILKPFLKRANMVAVERAGDVRPSLDASHDILKSGGNLLIFPEGTRSKTGKLGEFKSGIGHLLLDNNVLVVPVKIKGSYGIWKSGGYPSVLTGRKFKPSVSFGKALELDDITKKLGSNQVVNADSITGVIKEIIDSM